MFRIYILVSFLLLASFSCDQSETKKLLKPAMDMSGQSSEKLSGKPKNIILLIGDGMGLTQISAGMYSQDNKTALEEFKTIGLHKPHASNKLITDSAAAATSFACGVKTYNGAIGVDQDTIPVTSILEMAEAKGLKTGLVATSTIVHATPASFFSHNPYRKNYEAIAADIVNSGVDFFVGGGKKFFTNRDDERDLSSELTRKGYVVKDFFSDDMNDIKIDASKPFGFLTANEDPIPVSQGRDYLIPASNAAIRYLDQQEENFFLMIEGSQIDWGGHANDGEYVISEFIEYDKVIKACIDFAKKDKNTLVIVTADHETGGLAIQAESKLNDLELAFTSTYHTGTMIPVFAYGPGAEAFGGIYENTAIFNKMIEAYGW